MFSNKTKETAEPNSGASLWNGRGTDRSAPSIISNTLTIEGNLKTAGDIQVDGTIQGDIESRHVTVGEKAVVNGSVFAEEIVIRGSVNGDIHAKKVHLCESARVQGDICHETISIDTGAFIEGHCRHTEVMRDGNGADTASHGAFSLLKGTGKEAAAN